MLKYHEDIPPNRVEVLDENYYIYYIEEEYNKNHSNLVHWLVHRDSNRDNKNHFGYAFSIQNTHTQYQLQLRLPPPKNTYKIITIVWKKVVFVFK